MKYNLMPLKYFVDIVQTKRFMSAARRNYVSETAVSSAIKKLESELGQKLLNRNGVVLSVTPVGELFYKRAVNIIKSYNEIWYHPDPHPNQLLKIHFLQGFEDEAQSFSQKLPSTYKFAFDEEPFNTSISHLLEENYDILIGFELAFKNNPNIHTFSLKVVDFDLIFNLREVKKYNKDFKELAKKSMLFLQEWKSTGILDIQTAALEVYHQDGWYCSQVSGVNSFAAACLNVNSSGGVAMVPSDFQIPPHCDLLYRYSPAYLKSSFTVMAGAVNSNVISVIENNYDTIT